MALSRRLDATAFAVAQVLACGKDWDAYDPRLGPAASTASGDTTGATGGAAASSSTVTAGTGGSAWFDDGLSRRRAISVAAVRGSESLTDFPILVRLDATRIDYAATQEAGEDVRFVADDQVTVLAHEIELWDPAQASFLWVRLPELGPSKSTIWMYYGGTPSSPPPDPAATWSNGFLAVWHMGDNLADATGHGHDGTASGQVAPTAGIIAGARLFDGMEDFVSVAPSSEIDTLFAAGGTLSAWIRPDSGGESQRGRILDRSTDTSITAGWAMLMTEIPAPASVGFAHGFVGTLGLWITPSGSITYGAWQHVAASFSESYSAPTIYLDGLTQPLTIDSAPSGAPAPGSNLGTRIGARNGGVDRDFAGGIDELRLSNTVQSEAWVRAEVLAGQDLLLEFGAEQQR